MEFLCAYNLYYSKKNKVSTRGREENSEISVNDGSGWRDLSVKKSKREGKEGNIRKKASQNSVDLLQWVEQVFVIGAAEEGFDPEIHL